MINFVNFEGTRSVSRKMLNSSFLNFECQITDMNLKRWRRNLSQKIESIANLPAKVQKEGTSRCQVSWVSVTFVTSRNITRKSTLWGSRFLSGWLLASPKIFKICPDFRTQPIFCEFLSGLVGSGLFWVYKSLGRILQWLKMSYISLKQYRPVIHVLHCKLY